MSKSEFGTMRKFKVLFLSLVMFISGCVDWVEDKQDLVKFVNNAKATPAGKIQPIPEFKPYRSFVYEGATMREPFIALVQAVEEEQQEEVAENPGGLQPDLERKKEYLESFAIDQLTMVGTIVKRDDDLWALVRDSNSEIHRVGLGSYLGLDYGEVVELDEQQIVLSEIVSNGRGGWMKRSRNLVLSGQ